MNHVFKLMIPALFIAAAAIFWTPSPVMTQTVPLKIGAVDVFKIFDNYKKVQDLKKSLSTEWEALNQKYTQLEQQLKSELENFNVQREMMSEGAVKQKQAELQRLQREMMLELGGEKEKIQELESQGMEPILQVLNDVIREYAQQNGYDLIFKRQYMAFISEKYDITDEVIQILAQKP